MLLLRRSFICSCRLKSMKSLSKDIKFPEVYVSGIQPTGVPHIGNYFGFIQNWIKIQNEKPNVKKLLAIVDLHAITVGFPDPEQNTLDMTAGLLAAGVDPQQTIIFQQSDILEHTQLFWFLSSIGTIPRLQRLPQYKDKASNYTQGDVPTALLCYPLLQASDVMMYKGTHVPVGEDQDQHMHVLRDVAGSFNKHFQRELSKCPRIKSLVDPSKKMSKSDPSEWATLNISDPADKLQAKLKKAVTDFQPYISFDPDKRPAVSNLVTIYSAFSEQPIEDVVSEFGAQNHAQFKQKLVEIAEEKLGPVRREYERLKAEPCHIKDVLKQGGNRALEIAQKHMKEIKEIIGIL